MGKPTTSSQPSAASRRDWIQAIFVLAVLAAAIIIVYDVSSREHVGINDVYRYCIIFGSATAAMGVNLLSATVTAIDPITVIMIILLIVGVSLWVLSQALEISNDLRINMMNFGSGLLGVFVGWISAVAQKKSPDTKV